MEKMKVKKRILSLFLALVTLLCAVPFTAQAEEVVASEAEEKKIERADFYVKDGLVALFTAFDGSYISGSTWTDRVNGKKATLSSVAKKQWTLREGGGVGFNTYYGMIDQYGVFTETSSYNNSGVNAVRVNFGLSLFPQEDMTIEYLAEYLPVYVTDTSSPSRPSICSETALRATLLGRSMRSVGSPASLPTSTAI